MGRNQEQTQTDLKMNVGIEERSGMDLGMAARDRCEKIGAI